MKDFSENKTGVKPALYFRFVFSVSIMSLALSGCSIFATRPVQLMSDSAAALRAAKDAQADTLSPDLFRQANDWFLKARNEYQVKNFDLAEDYANKARHLAEQAEFDAIRNAGTTDAAAAPPPPTDASANQPPSPPPPEPIAKPSGIPYEDYEKYQASQVPPPPAPDPNPAPVQPPIIVAPVGAPAIVPPPSK